MLKSENRIHMRIGNLYMNNNGIEEVEVAIIGGGVTGAAVAYGLAKNNKKIVVLDASSPVDRASRSNMGLIWCQSKALGNKAYVDLGFFSSDLFSDLAKELQDLSGIDIEYRGVGGIIPCLGKEEFETRKIYMEKLTLQHNGSYPTEMLSREELEKKLPRIRFGKEVVGATWCEKDGFLNPLNLLFALRKGAVSLGATLHTERRVSSISRENGVYKLVADGLEIRAEKVVLAGGLSNRNLASIFGLHVPIYPDRGQVLLTERVPDILPIPLLGITRTPGGTIMVGFMHENVGADTGLVPESVAKEGRWAMRVWPDIAKLRVIRCWSSLRVMPKDSYPIYDTVPGHPNLFLFNTHSAVTLAAAHQTLLTDFVQKGVPPKSIEPFSLKRFNA